MTSCEWLRWASCSLMVSMPSERCGQAGAIADRLRQVSLVVRQIVDRFQPDRIIVFGSYAYGVPQPDSDVDLLVVMETPLRDLQQATLICQSIDYDFGLDLIVRTPAGLKGRLALGDPFLREVVERGRVLYERPGG
jgi:predicted nucleotidyltransferase